MTPNGRHIKLDYALGNAPNYTGVTAPTFAQQWTLDALGNWSSFKQDSNGGAPGSWDLAQNRSHNQANETTVVSGYIGLDWVDPVHDAAGNMTTLPQPKDPTRSYTAVYDAWNRLVEVKDGTSGATVAKYEYDGLGRRIVKQEYDTPGTFSRDRHYYYTGWRVIEERLDSSTLADRQFVWGLRYIDDLILRDRDANSGGGGNLGVTNSGLDERLYALQDAHFNVTTITDTTGTAVERYRYTPYGERTVLNASFVVKPAGSGFDWEVGHQGLLHDSETGLISNRMRMLHPILGRFMQRDPLHRSKSSGGYQDGMNLYQYVVSNPINWVDSLGLHKGDNHFGIKNKNFWRWWDCEKDGEPDLTSREDALRELEEWRNRGEPDAEGHRTKPERNNPTDEGEDDELDDNAKKMAEEAIGAAAAAGAISIAVDIAVEVIVEYGWIAIFAL